MSNSRIEQIIEEIEDYIDTCKGPLLSSGYFDVQRKM